MILPRLHRAFHGFGGRGTSSENREFVDSMNLVAIVSSANEQNTNRNVSHSHLDHGLREGA